MTLDTIGGNDKAKKIAEKLGYRSAEELKEDYVPKYEVDKYDIKYDKKTKELFLVRKDGRGEPIPTGLKNPFERW